MPLDEFVPVLGRFKRELGLTVFVHTGIIKQETAFALKDAGVDAALIDVIGSAETVEKIYNLKVTSKITPIHLKHCKTQNCHFVPHVIVGLNEGKLDGELQALQMIQKVKPSALVIIAFMPIHGTAMAKTPPPKPIDIAKVSAMARLDVSRNPSCFGLHATERKKPQRNRHFSVEGWGGCSCVSQRRSSRICKEQGLQDDFFILLLCPNVC